MRIVVFDRKKNSPRTRKKNSIITVAEERDLEKKEREPERERGEKNKTFLVLIKKLNLNFERSNINGEKKNA